MDDATVTMLIETLALVARTLGDAKIAIDRFGRDVDRLAILVDHLRDLLETPEQRI